MVKCLLSSVDNETTRTNKKKSGIPRFLLLLFSKKYINMTVGAIAEAEVYFGNPADYCKKHMSNKITWLKLVNTFKYKCQLSIFNLTVD